MDNLIGDILKELRQEKKITQDDIAELLKIKRQTYSAWERGKSSPDINTIIRLADYYSVNTDYLLGKTKVRKIQSQVDNIIIPEEFTTAEEAREYVAMHTIFSSGGVRPERLGDDEIIEFANALLEQMKMVSYKYKK